MVVRPIQAVSPLLQSGSRTTDRSPRPSPGRIHTHPHAPPGPRARNSASASIFGPWLGDPRRLDRPSFAVTAFTLLKGIVTL